LSRKQLTKLGDIFTYREGSDDVVSRYAKKLVQGAHSPLESNGTIGKSII